MLTINNPNDFGKIKIGNIVEMCMKNFISKSALFLVYIFAGSYLGLLAVVVLQYPVKMIFEDANMSLFFSFIRLLDTDLSRWFNIAFRTVSAVRPLSWCMRGDKMLSGLLPKCRLFPKSLHISFRRNISG